MNFSVAHVRHRAQQLLYWCYANVYPITALLAGAGIIAIGTLAEANSDKVQWLRRGWWRFGNDEVFCWVKAWAPHFGPELLILAFAALLVEGAVRKRERRQEKRYRSVQNLMDLLNYSLQRGLYFDGGSTNYFMLEKSAIERRERHARRRRTSLWRDELTLLGEAEKTAKCFIDKAIFFSTAADNLNNALARVRIELFGCDLSNSFWAGIAALENISGTVSRRFPQRAWDQTQTQTLQSGDILTEEQEQVWKKRISVLAKMQPDERIEVLLTNYVDDYIGLISIRGDLINTFSSFRSATMSFRDRVWKVSDPDEY
jgi:hypothetical protein